MCIKPICSLFIVGLIFLTVGCDKLCKSSVQDFATVQNTTGRQLTLNVCKGTSYGEVQTVVSDNGVIQEVGLGAREADSVQGGMNSNQSCSASDSKMRISLAPASFGQVKLCYDEASKLNVIVENYQACPYGFLEQTSTGSCDN
jgi:hypothetical protein